MKYLLVGENAINLSNAWNIYITQDPSIYKIKARYTIDTVYTLYEDWKLSKVQEMFEKILWFIKSNQIIMDIKDPIPPAVTDDSRKLELS